MSTNDNQKQKRVYQKPLLRTINLSADEILAAGCKTGQTSKPLGTNCVSNHCVSIGS